MKLNIMTRYILKEIFPNYLIGLGFISVILIVVQIFQLVSLTVEKNVPVTKVLNLLLLYIPLVMQFTLPIAVVVGTLLAVGRLSDDTEITAMRASGISLLKVFFPVMWFGLLLTFFTLLFYEIILPFAAERYAEAKIEMYQINPTAELSKSLSYDTIDRIRITVDSVDTNTNELVNVRINYLNENKLIFARRALLLSKDYQKNAFPLILFNSTMQPANVKNPKVEDKFDEQFNMRQTIYIPDRPSDAIIPRGNMLWSLSEFYVNLEKKKFQIALNNLRDYNRMNKFQLEHNETKRDYAQFVQHLSKNEKTMNGNLVQKQKMEWKTRVAKSHLRFKRIKRIIDRRETLQGRMHLINEQYLFHRKLAFSFSALAFAMLGAPLGIFSKRAGKSLGLGLSILIILLFFGMVFLGNFLMRN
ncbi:MAG: LptF/LptG family permease, partial [Spirochaetota bacterium]|nr:LptF/LptG family permease [Spirochaetota bacterium]